MLDLIQAIATGLLLGAVYALGSVGLSIVFSVMDIVHFGYGDTIMFGMYIGFFAWSIGGLDPLLSLPIGAVMMAGLCLLVYFGIIRPIHGKTPLVQITATFAVGLVLRGLAQWLFTPDTRRVTDTLAAGLQVRLGGVILDGPQLTAAAGAILCTGGVAWFVHRTETGQAMQAAGEDSASAALMGINPARMYALAWALAGLTAGAAGVLLAASFPVDPQAGQGFGLISFVAIALGGFGSVTGAAIGGVLIGLAQSVVGLYLPTYTLVAVCLLYLMVLAVRPQGLRGTR